MSDHHVGFLVGVAAGTILTRIYIDVRRGRFARWRRHVWHDRAAELNRKLIAGDESVESDLTRALVTYHKWIKRARRHG